MKGSERRFHLAYVVALATSLSLNVIFMSRSVIPKDKNTTKLRIVHSKNWHRNTRPVTKRPNTFSACILVNDDNHRLTEWLAYHYHVLPLDYLVVGVDPNSRTSPTPIFNQWRDYGMTIIEWNNTDIYAGMLWEYDNIVMNRPRMPHDHRQRQNMFLRNCLVHMKQAHRTWVLVTDSDEYLLFNGPSKTYPLLRKYDFPSIKNKGAIVEYLEREMKRPGNTTQKQPCISIPRVLFGSVESSKEELETGVPIGLNATMFDTMRYRKHLQRHKQKHDILNGWAKTMIDVSRVKDDDFPSPRDAFRTTPYHVNVHQPLFKVCPKPFIKDIQPVFRINHYVGSWESYSYRKDARQAEGRNKTTWMEKASAAEETDDAIREWLSGFVEEHGYEKASKMLQNVGVFSPRVPRFAKAGLFQKPMAIKKG